MNTILEVFFVILLGWAAGALVNYISDVLPLKRRLVRPFCHNCGFAYSLLNYFFWPRRCIRCNVRRTWRVWLVEVIFIALSIWLWHSPPEPLSFWAGVLILVYFGVVIVIDLEYKLIMHPVSLVGVALGSYIGINLNGWIDTVIGGVVGFAVMWFLYIIGELVVWWLSKRRGEATDEVALGFGDVNLSGVLGLMLGWPAILVGLVCAIVLGGFVSMIYLIIMLLLRRYKVFSALPYGPFLVAGAFLIIFFRDTLIALFGG